MALLILCGTVAFGSTTVRMAVPLYALTLLLGIVWALKLLTAEAVSWKKSLMHLPVGAFAIYALIRYCTSPLEYQSRLELFQVGMCTLVYFAAVSNFYHRRDRTILLLALLVLGVGESLFALWQYVKEPETLFGFVRPAGSLTRPGGTFFSPNHLAAFLVMVIGLAIGRLTVDTWSAGPLQKIAIQKLLLAFSLFICMLGLIVTMSRSGWLAAVVGLLVLLFWGEWKWARLWPRFLVAGIGVVLLVVLAFRTEGISNRFVHTYLLAKNLDKSGVNLNHSTLGPRLKIWNATVTIIRDHPLWGTGGGTWEWIYPKYRPAKVPSNPEYPHNEFLNLLSDYGLVGFALIAMALTCFYGHTYGLTRADIPSEERSFAVGSAIAVTSALAHAIFDFNLHILSNGAVFMTLMGFTVAMSENKEDRVPMSFGARYALAIGLLIFCGLGGWFVGRTSLAYHHKTLGDYLKLEYQTSSDDLRPQDAYAQAQVQYRKAIHLDSKNPDPYARMGDICLNQSQWRINPALRNERQALAREAIDWYQRALKLNPFYVEVLGKTARAYEILQEKEQVVKYCERAMELDPQSPITPLYLARFYLHQDDLPQAEKAAMRASVLNWGYNDPAVANFLEEIRSRKQKPQ